MKTPMKEMFVRIEQLRFAKNPIDEILKIERQMLDKERDLMDEQWQNGWNDAMDEVKKWEKR